jgi:hypothetical protein
MCLGIPRTPLVALPKCFLEDDLATLNHRTGDSIFPISKFSKSINYCGADRDRTCDLLNANQALSQLSYSPNKTVDEVGLRGLEPRTSSLSGMRSNHLSYKPKKLGYATNSTKQNWFDLSQITLRYSFKGGDPAAPSGTATLLRLRPSYQSYLNELLPEG